MAAKSKSLLGAYKTGDGASAGSGAPQAGQAADGSNWRKAQPSRGEAGAAGSDQPEIGQIVEPPTPPMEVNPAVDDGHRLVVPKRLRYGQSIAATPAPVSTAPPKPTTQPTPPQPAKTTGRSAEETVARMGGGAIAMVDDELVLRFTLLGWAGIAAGLAMLFGVIGYGIGAAGEPSAVGLSGDARVVLASGIASESDASEITRFLGAQSLPFSLNLHSYPAGDATLWRVISNESMPDELADAWLRDQAQRLQRLEAGWLNNNPGVPFGRTGVLPAD